MPSLRDTEFTTSCLQVWAVDLDITYSNQLAMTQMLLMMTGGTLNCRTGCLEAPMPIREKCCEHQIVPKVPSYICLYLQFKLCLYSPISVLSLDAII